MRFRDVGIPDLSGSSAQVPASMPANVKASYDARMAEVGGRGLRMRVVSADQSPVPGLKKNSKGEWCRYPDGDRSATDLAKKTAALMVVQEPVAARSSAKPKIDPLAERERLKREALSAWADGVTARVLQKELDQTSHLAANLKGETNPQKRLKAQLEERARLARLSNQLESQRYR